MPIAIDAPAISSTQNLALHFALRVWRIGKRRFWVWTWIRIP